MSWNTYLTATILQTYPGARPGFEFTWSMTDTGPEMLSWDEDFFGEPFVLDDWEADCLAIAKSQGTAKINGLHEKVLCRLTEDASAAERDTWAGKAAAVEAFANNSATVAQMALLEGEALAMGETVQEQADRIAAKSLAYHQVVGVTSGHRRKAIADLDAAATVEEMEGIVSALNAVYDAL